MSSKSPVFPFPEPQHFSDYGFDPQIDYFQVLEEARKHKRERSRSIDSIQFNLQKPISKHDSTRKPNPPKKPWWKKNPLFFFKSKCAHIHHHHPRNDDVHLARARALRASFSGPVHVTQTRVGSTARPASGPLAGKTDIGSGVSYLSLRELNLELQQFRNSTSAGKPVYLVT